MPNKPLIYIFVGIMLVGAIFGIGWYMGKTKSTVLLEEKQSTTTSPNQNTETKETSLEKKSPEENLEVKPKCTSITLPKYKVANEFLVDLDNDKNDELIRIYEENIKKMECPPELPIVVKIFSNINHCYEEKFRYPENLNPIVDFNDNRYNKVSDSQFIKNFWGDGRDVIFLEGTLNFCGSGSVSQLLFFTYQDGQYVKIEGPIFRELDTYFLSSPPKGKAILIVRGIWEINEAHFGPHRYAFDLYEWDGKGYQKKEIGTTTNKYEEEKFNAILESIANIFQNEPERLQSAIEKL